MNSINDVYLSAGAPKNRGLTSVARTTMLHDVIGLKSLRTDQAYCVGLSTLALLKKMNEKHDIANKQISYAANKYSFVR